MKEDKEKNTYCNSRIKTITNINFLDYSFHYLANKCDKWCDRPFHVCLYFGLMNSEISSIQFHMEIKLKIKISTKTKKADKSVW